ncbi:MAG: AMP-binding protein, partial [Acidobacteriota bacterium]
EELRARLGRVPAPCAIDDPHGSTPRIALLGAPSRAWVIGLHAIWRAGAAAVPLPTALPAAALADRLRDVAPALGLADAAHRATLVEALRGPADRVIDLDAPGDLDASGGDDAARDWIAGPPSRAALLLFTSGTTGRPKAAVITHGNLAAWTSTLHRAWRWSADDRIVGVLPLHHVHGLVNVVGCALAAGARCDLHPRFDAEDAWTALAASGVTCFMAVPSVYQRLVESHARADAAARRACSAAASRLRLAVSGSAALPDPLRAAWRDLGGVELLERYGMTEIGMALSQPYDGARVAGTVGAPLPGVAARVVDAAGAPVDVGVAGQLEIRGPNVFDGYFGRADATSEAFRDGWLRTGDDAIRARQADGSVTWRLLGRRSVDILKSGGELVSALTVEAVLLAHPAIRACAVVGAPDARWGQRVTAVVELRDGVAPPDLDALRAWSSDRLAPWERPRALRVVDALPRNALGKVEKRRVLAMLDGA